MASEHQFSRADARHGHPRAPDWIARSHSWARVAGVLAGVVAFFLIFYSPGLYYGNLGILVGLGWISSPAALVLSPIIGWLVRWLLGIVIRGETKQLHPRPARITILIMVAFFLIVVVGVATWIAVVSTPNSHA